jgi:hypothetical protein
MPVLVFFSLDLEDVDESKKEAFKMLEPSIKSLMSDVFVTQNL